MNLIYENNITQVFDNGDGTVKKVTQLHNEVDVAAYLQGKELTHVANYIKTEITMLDDPERAIVSITKEKLYNWDLLEFEIQQLIKYWDDSLIHAHDLFNYFNEYLVITGDKPLLEYRTPTKFIKYLEGFKNNPRSNYLTMVSLFKDLCNMVEELHSFRIYQVDFNSANFGYKGNHKLALFELGGAKIKDK